MSRLLATTNPGLESVAVREVGELVGADASERYPGAITFEADTDAVGVLNRRARSLHRVVIVLRDAEYGDLDGVYESTASLDLERYLSDDISFGVRPTRRGDQDFTSVDVGDVVGQATIDTYRDATGTRLEVDLDDPDAILRAFVREDDFLLGIDTTGERSLHRRPYRECEHNAPLRPTMAYALLRLAGYEPGDRVLDPMCGSATIPIEAAGYALGRSPQGDREYAFERLPFLDPGDPEPGESAIDPEDPPEFRGSDLNSRWVRCGRVNVRAADLEGVVEVEQGDATEVPIDTDVVATNLPFGIRTKSGDVARTHREFSENLREGSWRGVAALTTRPDLLDLPVDREIPVRYGRLDVSVVVARR